MKPPLNGPSDEALVELSKRGDLKAFESLIIRYQNILFRFLFHFMGNQHDAEDIVQETFIHLFRKLDQHNPAQKFSSWLLTIARNLAVSNFRKGVPTPVSAEVLSQVVKDVCPSPEGELLVQEDAKEIQAALKKVPETQREVLIMRYFLDFPLRQVAEILNLPEGTVKSRLFKARAELLKVLNRLGKSEG